MNGTTNVTSDHLGPDSVNDGWQTVGGKRNAEVSSSLDDSPTPLNTFKTLKRIDEVEEKLIDDMPSVLHTLSKSQLKKLKRAQGRSPRKSP